MRQIEQEFEDFENISQLIDEDVDNESKPVGESVVPNLSNNLGLASRMREFN